MRVKTETYIADEQAGFQQGRGTRDQITSLRILMHRAHAHQQQRYMWFVDFKKALNSISHDKLWVTMTDMGYPLHLIDLLAKLAGFKARSDFLKYSVLFSISLYCC